MNSLNSGSSPDKIFKFWETKNGTVVMGIGALVLVPLLYVAFPFITAFFVNLFTTLSFAIASAIALAIASALYIILSNKRLWMAVTLFSDNMSRKILRGVIDSNPVASALTALSRMRAKLDKIRQSATKLSANRKSVEKDVNANTEERQSELELASAALKQNRRIEAEKHAAIAEELLSSNNQLLPVLKQLQTLEQVYKGVIEHSEAKIEVFDRKIKIKSRELSAKKAGQDAARDYKATFQGDDAELLGESLESIADQINVAEAEMEQFITEIMPELQAGELQRGVDAEKGMASLQKWLADQNQKSDSDSLIPSSNARAILGAGAAQPLAQEYQSPALDTSSFDKLFDK